ncbi:MAG TPA: MerR family transcriptional regulator [Gammaproteobacteria bacterium]|nr:MerR family transcriptional regulator [Gammaproteobacteria bacterium]
MTEHLSIITGTVLEDETGTLSMAELCRACGVHAEHIVEFVEYGILEPRGREMAAWQFPPSSLRRAQRALRLQEDLSINAAGIALALELLDELSELRARLAGLQGR